MTRTARLYYDRRPLWTAWGLIGALALACGKETTTPPASTAVAPVQPEQPATVIPAGGLPPAPSGPVTPASTGPSSFKDLEAAFKAGKYVEAKAGLATYVKTKPDQAFGHYLLGLAAWKSGDLKTAETALERALALDSSSAKTELALARVLLDSKRAPEAIERIEKVLDRDSTSIEGYRLLARATSATGQTESAIALYRTVLTLDERDLWAMNNLGTLYLDSGKPELALGPLARTVQLKPTAPIFQNNLGIALERTGHFTGAKAAYEAALKADSGSAKAKANLERLTKLVIDPSDTPATLLTEEAETFRLQVQMWKDR